MKGNDQIQGWKDIAAYLGRDERTAKRWEKQRGLPVRRIPGSGRANVYVLSADLEAWLAKGRPEVTIVEPQSILQSLPAALQKEPQEPPPMRAISAPAIAVEPLAEVKTQHDTPPVVSKPLWPWIAGSLILVSVSMVAIATRSRVPERASVAPALVVHAVYKSPVPGVDELYLRGVYSLEQRSPESLQDAQRLFTQVTERDGRDAAAYAGLAETYLLSREYASMSPVDAYGLARVAAERALALDPELAEAHASLGFIEFFSSFKPQQAAENFRTAIRLDPNCVVAHHWFGSMLTHQARYKEALAELDTAQRLQPASAAILSSKAYALGLSGRRDEARAMLDTMIKNDPNAAAPHRILASISLQAPRDMPLYLDELQRFLEIRHDSDGQRELAVERDAFNHGGQPALWRTMLASEQRRQAATGRPSYTMAEAEAELGDADQALRDLKTLGDQRDLSMAGILIDPAFDAIRGDPRFVAMATALGLNAP